MDSMSSVVIFNLIFAFVELASCLDDRGSDHFLLKLMYGERTRDAMLANRVGGFHQALHVQAGTVAIAVWCMSAWPTHTRILLRPISIRLCLSHLSALLTALHTKHIR